MKRSGVVGTKAEVAMEVAHVPVGELRAHPRNYRSHPDDQLDHIAESIKTHGFYRNVVVSRDGYVLAGHGVVEAARREGVEVVPVVRVDVVHDSPQALRLLIGDNAIGNLAEVDDRALTEALKELKELNPTFLLGTGYDERMLAGLVFVTRTRQEVRDKDEAAEWVGMPEYDTGSKQCALTVTFANHEDRMKFVEQSALNPDLARKYSAKNDHWSTWWPQKEDKVDLMSARFEVAAERIAEEAASD